jgi:hypothetical protein
MLAVEGPLPVGGGRAYETKWDFCTRFRLVASGLAIRRFTPDEPVRERGADRRRRMPAGCGFDWWSDPVYRQLTGLRHDMPSGQINAPSADFDRSERRCRRQIQHMSRPCWPHFPIIGH